MRKTTIVFSLLFVFFGMDVTAQAAWELAKEKGDLQVYTRKQEGTDYKEVKVLTVVHSSINELVAAMEDVESQPDWAEGTKEARVIEQLGTGSFLIYQISDMPYPVQDRDVVMKYTRTQDPSTKVVTIEFVNVSDKKPVDENYVRIPSLHSKYILSPAADNKIDLQYQLNINMGGKLPKWVINMGITKGTVDSLEGLIDLVESGEYKGTTVEGLQEF